MKRFTNNLKMSAIGMIAMGGVLVLTMSPVLGQSTGQQFQANLSSLNDSGASATAWIEHTGSGNEATVKVETDGLLEDNPHAQHIHFTTTSNGVCPGPERADEDDREGSNDEIISTAEGQPDYGSVQVSLTESGDTSADSALAVDRMPTGNYSYERTVELTDEVVEALPGGNVAMVIHGIDINGNGSYDNDDGQGTSSLDDSLPLEATAPAACGMFTSVPTGAAQTGDGGTSGIENIGMLSLGVAAVIGAGGLYAYRQRTASNS